jgi:hypothetical protein
MKFPLMLDCIEGKVGDDPSPFFLLHKPLTPKAAPSLLRPPGKPARKIAALASACGVTIGPHTGASGAVSIAAAVQWASSLSNLYIFEHMYTENPLRTEVLKDPVLECHDAIIKVPGRPGLGIEIDTHQVKKYTKTCIAGLRPHSLWRLHACRVAPFLQKNA